MSLKTEFGEVSFGEHVSGMKPTHYLLFNKALNVDAEEFIRALISPPYDRRRIAGLTHYRIDMPNPDPPTTFASDLIVWDPASAVPLRVGSTSFFTEEVEYLL